MGQMQSDARRRTDIDIALLDDNHGAVDLVDDTVDLLASTRSVPRQVLDMSHTSRETHIGKASENISSPVMISSYNSILVSLGS